jgi:hypothetical protein
VEKQQGKRLAAGFADLMSLYIAGLEDPLRDSATLEQCGIDADMTLYLLYKAPGDRLALEMIHAHLRAKQAVGGRVQDIANWIKPGEPLERWRGVDRVNADGRVTELNLGCLNLMELPPCIGYLTELRVLYLHSNKLRALPVELGALVRLEK